MHQERQFPGRAIGTDSASTRTSPRWRRSFGAHRGRSSARQDFEAAFERALALGPAGAARAACRSRGDQPARQPERAAGQARLMSREELGSTACRADLATTPTPFVPATCSSSRARRRSTAEGALVGGDDVVAQARQVFANMRARARRRPGAASGTSSRSRSTSRTSTTGRRSTRCARRSSATPRPASTLVEVSRLAVPGAKVEVDAVALIPS